MPTTGSDNSNESDNNYEEAQQQLVDCGRLSWLSSRWPWNNSNVSNNKRKATEDDDDDDPTSLLLLYRQQHRQHLVQGELPQQRQPPPLLPPCHGDEEERLSTTVGAERGGGGGFDDERPAVASEGGGTATMTGAKTEGSCGDDTGTVKEEEEVGEGSGGGGETVPAAATAAAAVAVDMDVGASRVAGTSTAAPAGVAESKERASGTGGEGQQPNQPPMGGEEASSADRSTGGAETAADVAASGNCVGVVKAASDDNDNDNSSSTQAPDLYLGITGWKELEDGLPLVLCMLRRDRSADEVGAVTATTSARRTTNSLGSSHHERNSIDTRERPATTPAKRNKKRMGAADTNRADNNKKLKITLTAEAMSVAMAAGNSSGGATKKKKKKKAPPPPSTPDTIGTTGSGSCTSGSRSLPSSEIVEGDYNIYELSKNDVISGTCLHYLYCCVDSLSISLLLRKLTPFEMNYAITGRGNHVAGYRGNKQFREIVSERRGPYQNAPRRLKGRIARSVVDEIYHVKKGRFVEKHPFQNVFRELSEVKAIEKSSQALREKAWLRKK